MAKDTKTLTVSLTAEVAGLRRGMDHARRELSGFQRASQSAALGVSRAFAGLIGTGGALAGIGLAFRKSMQDSIAFESAFAEVRKTVDATEVQFSELRQELIDLSVQTGETATGLMQAAAAAGQTGIKTENILEVTKAMTEMAAASDMTSENAAISFSQWTAITGLTQDKIDNLSDSVVALGSKTAATESGIMQMGLRLASSGALIGMTDAQTVGLAASLRSVGIEAEMGGTAMSKIMRDVAQSVEQGGDKLELFAALSGQSSQEFKDSFGRDGIGAIMMVISGFAKYKEAGGQVFTLMEQLGLDAERQTDTFIRLAQASEMVGDNMAFATKEFERSAARTEEANERYKTSEYQIKQMQNSLTALRVELVESFKPAMNGMISDIKWFSESLRSMNSMLDTTGGVLGIFKDSFVALFQFTKTGFWLAVTVITKGFQYIQGAAMMAVSSILSAIGSLVEFTSPMRAFGDAISGLLGLPTLSSLFENVDLGKGADSFWQSGMDMFNGTSEYAKWSDTFYTNMTSAFGNGVSKFKGVGTDIISGIFSEGTGGVKEEGQKAGSDFATEFTKTMMDMFAPKDTTFVDSINSLMSGADKDSFGYKITESLMDMFGGKSSKEDEVSGLMPKLAEELGYQKDITGELEKQSELTKDAGEFKSMRAGEGIAFGGRISGGMVQSSNPAGGYASSAASGAATSSNARTGADSSITLLQGILNNTAALVAMGRTQPAAVLG